MVVLGGRRSSSGFPFPELTLQSRKLVYPAACVRQSALSVLALAQRRGLPRAHP